MNEKYIEYIDASGRTTQILFYRHNYTGATYELCSQDTILTINWYGDIDKYIIGSEAVINILIKDENDENELLEFFQGDDWYVEITKDGNPFWYGKLQYDFFSHSYQGYPYVVEINASDQLGSLKQYQFLYTDFPEVFVYSGLTYNLYDIIKLSLRNSGLKPTDTDPSHEVVPKYMNFSSIIKPTGTTNLLSSTYINQFIFDDGKEFISISDALEMILKPLDLQLYQYYGEWWLLSKDIYKTTGFTYKKYNLASDIYSNEIFNDEIIEAQNPPLTQSGTTYILGDAQIEYIQPYRKINVNKKYKKNENIIKGFFNKNGNFYDGLELSGDTLPYWDYEGTPFDITGYTGGLLKLPMVQYSEPYGGTNDFIYIKTPVNQDTLTDGLNFSISSYFVGKKPNGAYYDLAIGFVGSPNGIEAWYNKSTEWKIVYTGDTSGDFQYITNEIGEDFSIENVRIPYLETLLGPSYYIEPTHILIAIGKGRTIFNPASYPGDFLINKMQLSFTNQSLDGIDYENTQSYILNNTSSQKVEDLDIELGLEEYSDYNEFYNHYSSLRYQNGNAINLWEKTGYVTGQTIDYWILQNRVLENYRTRSKLKSSFYSNHLTPQHLFQDYEGRVYRFLSGSLNDQKSIWDIEYIQYNNLEYLYGLLIECFISDDDYTYKGISLTEGDGYISDDNFSISGDELLLGGDFINENDFYINDNGYLIYTGI